jgi:uncharacterized protein (TIGR01777 family)
MSPDAYTAGPSTAIAISGATGFIGRALVERLRARGHTVHRLVRRGTAVEPRDILWDPARGLLDPASLAGIRAVVHLAGEPIAHRWTAARKTAIRDSRVQGTGLLARTLAALDEPPVTLLSGSAVGYYGSRGDELLDEGSAAGGDFLAVVTQEWERATAPASAAGIRTVLLRTGIVLDAGGGVLERLLPPFRLGVGGPIGSGRQWMSWIALEDELRAIEHALWTDSLRGPLNLVAPNPVTNAEFAATLGRVLARPAVLPVPAFALELLFGEMADATILAGQRAMPRVLAASGFEFALPTLEQALRRALGR